MLISVLLGDGVRCRMLLYSGIYGQQAPKLPVRENDAGQVFVANLSQIPIDSVEDFDSVYS